MAVEERTTASHLNSNKSIWFWGIYPLKVPSPNKYNSPCDLKREVYYEKTNWK